MLRDRENRDPFGRKPAISPGGGAERLRNLKGIKSKSRLRRSPRRMNEGRLRRQIQMLQNLLNCVFFEKGSDHFDFSLARETGGDIDTKNAL